MKITPLEIRQKSFEKSFRGINKEEVNAFLLSLSHEWERMLDENKVLKVTQDKLEKEVQKLRDVETTLFKTLKTAEETGASVVEQAQKTAQLHMREAQMNADAMISDAKNQARAIIDQAEGQTKDIIEEMNNEVKELEENYRIIENQRENVISQLKLLSGDVMHNVEKIKHQESGIETHLKKVKQMLRETNAEKAEHKKSEEIKFNNPTSIRNTQQEINLDDKKFDISKADKAQVKKNYIPENSPVSRTPAPNPKKSGAVASESNDFSFFDQLED